MRAADLDLIFVPERQIPDDSHWQARWSAKLSSARFVGEPVTPEEIAEAAKSATKPISSSPIRPARWRWRRLRPTSPVSTCAALLVAPPSRAGAIRWSTVAGARRREPGCRSRACWWRAAPTLAPFEESTALAADWGADLHRRGRGRTHRRGQRPRPLAGGSAARCRPVQADLTLRRSRGAAALAAVRGGIRRPGGRRSSLSSLPQAAAEGSIRRPIRRFARRSCAAGIRDRRR